MLNDAVGFEKIFSATGYTDLRRGIDGLASTIKFQFDLDPFQKHVLFLFCGKRTDRIKGLVWEGDGFLLLYKRLNIGGFSWPRKGRSHGDYTRAVSNVDAGIVYCCKTPNQRIEEST